VRMFCILLTDNIAVAGGAKDGDEQGEVTLFFSIIFIIYIYIFFFNPIKNVRETSRR